MCWKTAAMTDFAVGHMAMFRFHVDIFQFRPLKKKTDYQVPSPVPTGVSWCFKVIQNGGSTCSVRRTAMVNQGPSSRRIPSFSPGTCVTTWTPSVRRRGESLGNVDREKPMENLWQMDGKWMKTYGNWMKTYGKWSLSRGFHHVHPSWRDMNYDILLDLEIYHGHDNNANIW